MLSPNPNSNGESQTELGETRFRIADGLELLQVALPNAVEAVPGARTKGVVFQAALAYGVGLQTAIKGPRATIYAGREDNTHGRTVTLANIAGGAEVFSERCVALVQLLRLKVEDDGDLRQAEVLLTAAASFLSEIDEITRLLGYGRPYQTLRQLQGLSEYG